MKSSNELKRLLESIDRKSYPAYKSAQGIYDFGDYQLCIDHVQGDPFASPSKLHGVNRIRVRLVNIRNYPHLEVDIQTR